MKKVCYVSVPAGGFVNLKVALNRSSAAWVYKVSVPAGGFVNLKAAFFPAYPDEHLSFSPRRGIR